MIDAKIPRRDARAHSRKIRAMPMDDRAREIAIAVACYQPPEVRNTADADDAREIYSATLRRLAGL